MRILIVTDQYQNIATGTGAYARNLARGLRHAGHEITIITFGSATTIRNDVISLKPVPFSTLHPTWVLKSYAFSSAINREISGCQYDLIHFLDARESLYFKNRRLPVIGTMNDYYFAETPPTAFEFKPYYTDWLIRWEYYKFVRWLEKRCLSSLTHVISCCAAVQHSICKQYNLTHDSVSTIHYGLEPLSSKPRSLAGDQLSIAFIGNNVQRKGLPLLIKAAPRIAELCQDFRVVVLGQNAAIKSLQSRCKRMNVSRHFEFKGHVSHDTVMETLSRSTMCVLPSLMEAFPNTLLESMQLGVPVIGGNVGGIRELIQDGENGILVNPTDPIELANKITLLSEDNDLRQKFRDNAFQSVQQFSQERMVRETLVVYERAIRAFTKA